MIPVALFRILEKMRHLDISQEYNEHMQIYIFTGMERKASYTYLHNKSSKVMLERTLYDITQTIVL